MKILNIGSLNIDYVYDVDHIVAPGETIASSTMNIFAGGKGLNQSVALAKAGADVCHGGLIGDDGQIFLDVCNEYGIDSDYIRRIEGKSGHAIIQVGKNAQNSILLFGGTNQCFSKEIIDGILSDYNAGDLLLLQNEVNMLSYIIDAAYSKGIIVVLNPSPYNEKINDCDLTKVSIFLLNEIEGEQITGYSNEKEIIKSLTQKFPDAKIVLTLGKDGVVYAHKNEIYKKDSYKVNAVDTTAAGDTFTGYFLAGITKGMDIPNLLDMCVKASAIAVSRKGATSSIPTLDEVIKF